MDNLYRRSQILDIIRSESPPTQTALRRKLAERGIRVTQATVSRDMEELGVVKTREGYRLPAAAAAQSQPNQPSLSVILKEFVREVALASNLVIVKTHPGNAHTVAVALDTSHWSEIRGSVAGDDTIFLATADAKQASRIRAKIQATLAE
jgi:transcriptional regulator of arginine metabolism